MGEVRGYCLEDLLKQLLLLNSCTTTTSSCWSTGLQEGAGVHQDHPAQRGLRHWGYLDGGVVTIVARLDKPIYYVGFSISKLINLSRHLFCICLVLAKNSALQVHDFLSCGLP